MYTSNALIELIGKSEADSNVQKLLSELGHSKPLKRPKRGEVDSYVECPKKGVTLLFRLAEGLSNEVAGNLPEGALVMKTVFFSPVKNPNLAIYKDLPNNLQFSTARKEARKLLGKPEWSGGEGVNNDRWQLGRLKMIVDFNDDESSIEAVTVQLPNE